MLLSEFKIGLDFRFRGALYRCTDIGTRTIAAINMTEVWVTKTKANTGEKQRVRVANVSQAAFNGPPYGVEEIVLPQTILDECVTSEAWESAKKVLGISEVKR